MKYDVTELLFNRNIFKFDISSISDKVYIDFGNEIDLKYADNIKIIYDYELNKTFIDPYNVNITEGKTKIYCVSYYNIHNKIIEIDNKTLKSINNENIQLQSNIF